MFKIPIYDEAKIIHVDDTDEWFEILEKNKIEDYLIDYHYDPDHFEFGFIVRKNSGSYCYKIPYAKLYIGSRRGYDFSTIEGITKMVKEKK